MSGAGTMSSSKPRRPRGEGSIRHDGDRWIVRLEAGGHARKRVCRTQADALKALDELKKLASMRLPPGRYSVAMALDDFLSHGANSRGWAATTQREYGSAINLHLRPRLGKVLLVDLGVREVQRVLDDLLEGGHSGRHVAHIRGVLRAAISHAMRQELVGRNVAALAASPQVRRAEMQALSASEVHSLFKAMEGERLRPLVVTAAMLGLRRGELIALKWSDIDLDRATLTVRRTGTRINREYVEGPPKSAKSRRTIALPPTIAEMLREQRGAPLAYVFPGELGGPTSAHAIDLALKRGLIRAGLPPIRVHDLRHTAASVLLGAGGTLRDAQEMLGHASYALTADLYAHLSEDQRKATADRMERAFGAAIGDR